MAVSDQEKLLIDIGVDLKDFNRGINVLKKNYKNFEKFVAGMRKKYRIKAAKEELAAQKKINDEKLKIEKKAIDAKIASMKKVDALRKKEIAKEKAERKKLFADLARMGIEYYNFYSTKKLRKMVAVERAITKVTLQEQKKRALAASKQSNIDKTNWDFSGHRGLIDSTLVVAKYGTISQALYGLQRAFGAVAGEIVRMNDSLYTNMAVLNKTEYEAKQLSKAVVDIGKQYGGDLNDIQEAMLTLGRAGVEQTDILINSTKVLRELALITGDDMRDGAEAMSSMINVYKIGGDEIKNLGDQMGYVANETRLGIRDFSTISNYALVAAKNIGLTRESYLALNGVLSKAGFNASTIGTNIRRLNKILYDDSKKNVEMFRVLGYSQKEFAKAMEKDSNKALRDFVKQIMAVDPSRYKAAVGDMDVLTRQLLDGLRGGGEFFGKFLDALTGTSKEMRSLSGQADQMSKGMTISFQRIWNSIKTGADEFANLEFHIDQIYRAATNAKAGLDLIIKALSDIIAFIPVIGQLVDAIAAINTTGAMVTAKKSMGKGIDKLVQDIEALQKANAEAGGLFGITPEQVAENEKIIAQKTMFIKKIYEQEQAMGKQGLTMGNVAEQQKQLNKAEEEYVTKPIKQAEISEKTKEYMRQAQVARDKLNGSFKQSVMYQKELNSLRAKEQELVKAYTDKGSIENQEALAKVRAQIAEKELDVARAKKTEADKAARSGSTLRQQVKDASKLTDEMAKQKALAKEMLMIKGDGVHYEKLSTRVLREQLKIAKQAVKDTEKLRGQGGKKGELMYQKKITKEMEVELKLMKAMSGEINKWQSAFDSLFSGDISGAISTVFGDMFKSIQTSVADIFGGITSMLGPIMGGLTGSLINLALDALQGLFESGKVWTPEEYQKSIGAVSSPESDSIVNLLSSIDWSMSRNLMYSKGIYDNLSALVEQAGKAAVGLSGTYSFANQDAYTPGALGGIWGGKDVKTLFTGMELQAQAINNIVANTVDTLQTTKTSWFGLKKKTTTTTIKNAVNSDIQNAIDEAYRSGAAALLNASQALGVAGAESIINGFTGAMHTLNFEGKTTEEIQQILQGAISADLDALARQLVPWIEQFQKAGEQMLETMGRLVYEMEVFDYGLEQLGGGLQIVGVHAVAAAEIFYNVSGGMDAALSNIQGYIDNFYTDAEKQALRIKELQKTGIFIDEQAYKDEIARLTELASVGNTLATQQLANLLANQDIYREYFDYINELEQQAIDDAKQAAEDKLNAQKEAMQNELAFHEDILNRIENAYTGTLNYMNSLEKASVLGELANVKLASGDTQGYFDTLYKQLEYEKNVSTTREEYAQKFDRYIAELQGADYEPKTLDDVVDSLDELIEQNKKIEDAIATASYQPTLSTSYTGV